MRERAASSVGEKVRLVPGGFGFRVQEQATPTMNDAATDPQEHVEAAPTNFDGNFPATRWSVVLRAQSTDPAATAALAELCRMYWRPVYSFLRRQGNASHDAEDLTQGFFVMLLDRKSFSTVEEARGRLRSFLLVLLKRFAANEYQRERTQKRGGAVAHVPIDTGDAEEHYTAELATGLSPDLLFERQWAITLLDTVMAKLHESYARDGREAVFDALKGRFSADNDSALLASVAAQLGMNESAVKVALHRMRERYRKLLRSQIALTVDSPQEVDEEILHLFKALGNAG
jgi:DNA-directed RNA polymerase specialized sigma24 family protein